MFKIKAVILSFLAIISLSLFTTSILAGGGSVYVWTWDNASAWRSDYKLIYARAHLSSDVPCIGTKVTFSYENPQPGDNVSAGGENGSFTFSGDSYKVSKFNGQRIPDCNTYAKFYSTNNTLKTGVAEFKTVDGKVYKGTFALNFQLSNPGNTDPEEKYPLPWEEEYIKKHFPSQPVPTTVPLATSNTQINLSAPEMVYPVDGQTIDLEGAYMFKVKPVAGASGYLFDLFQDNVMVYENWRDDKYLSSTEFALWNGTPYHAKFHAGNIKVTIRAYINNQWTEAREITVYLKPRSSTSNTQPINPSPANHSTANPSYVPAQHNPPVVQPGKVITVIDSSASAALQQKVNELQQKLEVSEQKQSVLELKLNQILTWIKSVYPFFK